MKVFTDTEQMQEASNEFSVIINDMRDIYINLNSLIKYLEPTWQGNASKEYLNGLRNQLSEINNTIEALEAMKETADERARTALSLDRLESLNIINIGTAIVDTAASAGSAIGSLFGW